MAGACECGLLSRWTAYRAWKASPTDKPMWETPSGVDPLARHERTETRAPTLAQGGGRLPKGNLILGKLGKLKRHLPS